ncbi:hypothetical protein ExPCM14_00115 [Escherichia coli]|nr:hypothetical protein ExPCM14_00115 [Escherichia coli]
MPGLAKFAVDVANIACFFVLQDTFSFCAVPLALCRHGFHMQCRDGIAFFTAEVPGTQFIFSTVPEVVEPAIGQAIEVPDIGTGFFTGLVILHTNTLPGTVHDDFFSQIGAVSPQEVSKLCQRISCRYAGQQRIRFPPFERLHVGTGKGIPDLAFVIKTECGFVIFKFSCGLTGFIFFVVGYRQIGAGLRRLHRSLLYSKNFRYHQGRPVRRLPRRRWKIRWLSTVTVKPKWARTA